jgi:hypothetical protein
MANFSFEEALRPLPEKGFSFEEANQPAAGFSFEDAIAPPSGSGRVRTERDQELAVGEEAVTGVKAGAKSIANLPAILSLQKDADIAGFRKKELDAFSAIDEGRTITPAEASRMGVDYARIMQYQRAKPEQRQEFKAFNQQAVDKAQVGVQEGLKLYAEFVKDMEKYQGRTPDFTDIQTGTDFANWLSYNVGSGAVQLAPVILAAVTTGSVGAFGVGTALASQETLQNRINFVLDKTKDQPPEAQADAVEKYLRETGNTNALVALGSGALDLAGPVGTILRNRLAKEAGKEVTKYATKREAAKAAAKRAPREILEEGATGAGQEAIQIAGKRALEEQVGDILSEENIKSIINAATAEAAGGLAGSGFNVATAVGQQAVQERANRIAQEELNRQLKSVGAPPVALPTVAPAAPVEPVTPAITEEGLLPGMTAISPEEEIGPEEVTPSAIDQAVKKEKLETEKTSPSVQASIVETKPAETEVTPSGAVTPKIPELGFRTEKGSIYSLDEQNRTSRTKMSEGKGKGTTYEPHAALYVTPQDAQNILSDMQSGSIDKSTSVRLGYIDLENNTFKTVTDTSQIPAGAEAFVGVVDKNKNQLIGSYKAQLTPAVGLSPVEKLYTPDGMANTHIGNKIVEIFGQPAAPSPPVVPAEPIEEPLPEVLAGAPMPKPEELEQAEADKARLEAERKALLKPVPGQKNLYATLRGQVAIDDVFDISPDKTFNLLKNKRGKPISDLVYNGQLNDFLPESMRPDSETFDLAESEEYIKNKLRSNDYIPYETDMRLRENGFLLEDAEKILEFYDVNKRLQEITREELALAEAEAAEFERSAGIFGEPEAAPPASAFEVREPTPEDKRRVDLERDLFRLTPPPTPERTTPPGMQGDIFGARGMEAQPARAQPPAEPTPIERAAAETKPEKEAKPTKEEQAAINRARQAEKRKAAKAPEETKIEAEKEKNLDQLKLFEEGPISENEDNTAGETARRKAVSTVDDLQSTNNPLALALSKDYAAKQRVDLVGQTVKSHEDLAILSQVYRHPNFETVRLFFVNDAGEVVSQLGVSSRLPGSSNAIIGDSGKAYVAKVQKLAKQSGATGVWMLHNHPSGNVEPSNADRVLTSQAAKLFTDLDYKGHIVIDTNKYSVIAPDGKFVTVSKDMSQEDLVTYDPRQYKEIFNPISMAKEVDQNPDSMVLVVLSAGPLKATTITTIPNSFFKNKTEPQIRRALFKLVLSRKGGRLLAASRDLEAMKKIGPMVVDGVHIKPDGSWQGLGDIFALRRSFLFPAQRPAVVTPDSSKVFDFLKVPKEAVKGDFIKDDLRKVQEKVEKESEIVLRAEEPQADLFEDANKNPPKVEVKLPPGRSKELAELAQKIQTGEATREEYDAAVKKYAPIYVFTSAKKPATDAEMSGALNVTQKQKINNPIPSGTKVGARLDIDAKRKYDVAVVAIHEAKPRATSPAAGRAISYRSTIVLKNVQFAIGSEAATLNIAAGEKKNSLQTMEGELVDMSPEEAYRKAEQVFNDPSYVQVGFDPIRHSYFYDRVSTIPVVRADEVIQIGDMVLAKNPQFGRKDQFLFNIDESQGDLFGEKETKAFEKTEETLPGAKTVKKDRSPELTAAAEKLRRGEITKKEYEEAVQRFSPVSVYAEPPKPASNAQVVEALDANKRKDANVNIESGTKVGLRLDIPAWTRGKTWVVAIHEAKAKITSPKALEVLSYRSVAALKNVMFGVGDQARTLRIAAGEFKDKLQTMEGEYVNISPEEAYRRAQELIKDPAYIQVGFNPTRHAYFYDRRTMVPVVSASEVLQIGNFILAKDPVFGSKDDFLFEINTPIDDGDPPSDELIKEIMEQDKERRAIERQEKIAQYAGIRRRQIALNKKIRDYGTTIETQRLANNLDKIAQELREGIFFSSMDKERVFSAENFLRQARAALDGTTPYKESAISEDVFAVIQAMYMDDPNLLEGLRLSVKPQFSSEDAMVRRAYKFRGAAGSFQPFTRLVALYTGTKGVTDPVTVRHEVCHSLEQMMTIPQRELIFKSYLAAIEKAAKKHTDKRSQEFFDRVIDFLNDPSEITRKEVSKALPSMDFYQYVNPSEYWAVNAEKLMAQRLGTPWQRFKKSIRKLYEKLKDLFGFNPDFVVHDVFDNIMSGSKKRLDRESLMSYLEVSGYKFDFLENIEDDQNLVDKYKRPDTPMLDATPIKTAILGSAQYGKEFFKDIVTSPGKAINTLFTGVERGLLYLRNKNVWFGSGLNAADFRQYNGALRTSEGIATASVALDNMIRGGNISVQVVTRGGIKFNKDSQMFVATDTKKGMTGVYKAEAALKDKLGAQLGTNIIQGYLEAKRSRSIQNEFYDRQEAYEEAKGVLQDMEVELRRAEADPKTSSKDLAQIKADVKQLRREVKELKEDFDNVAVAFEKINMTDEEIDEFIDRDSVHPELREIMDNWTAVNQNLLRFWRQVGLLSEKRYNTLSNIKDYVPWYRIMADEEDVHSPVQATTRSATNIGKEKLFKKGKPTVVSDFVAEDGQTMFRIQPGKVDSIEVNGKKVPPSAYNVEANGEITFKKPMVEGDLVVIEGVREIENIIDNMTRNVMRMTMNGLRQYAAQRIVSEYASRNEKNKIMTFPSEDRDRGRFNFISNGQRVVVEIRDPLIAEAALGMEKVGMEMFKPLATIANFTRRTITLSPVFQIKQVFKDAPTAAIVTGVKNPAALLGGVYKGFASSLLQSDPAYDILRAAGIGGFYSPARTPEAEVKRQIGVINKSTYDYVIKAMDHIGDASDMAQRIATYNRVMAETGDQAQALYQAANVINFMRHGSGQVSQALFKTVPFMNAYAQSIDVLFQSLAGGGLKGVSRQKALQRLAVTGSLLAATTIIYSMLVGDDEEYQKLDDQTKLRGYFIPGTEIMLPMNTSAAFFFKAIPEMMYNYFVSKGTDKPVDEQRLRTALKEAAADMLLGPSPVPSAAKPVIEIGLNRDFFSGRPITPRALEDLEASRQFTYETSEAAKALSDITSIFGTENRVLNPMEADHFIRGVFGSAGAMVAWSTNVIGAAAGERVAPTAKQAPVVGPFLRPKVPRGPEDLFYDLKERTDKKHKTFEDLLNANESEKALEYAKKYPGLIVLYEYTNETKAELDQMNELIRMIGRSSDKSYSPEQRRKDIETIQRGKQDLLKGIEQFRRQAFKGPLAEEESARSQ